LTGIELLMRIPDSLPLLGRYHSPQLGARAKNDPCVLGYSCPEPPFL